VCKRARYTRRLSSESSLKGGEKVHQSTISPARTRDSCLVACALKQCTQFGAQRLRFEREERDRSVTRAPLFLWAKFCTCGIRRLRIRLTCFLLAPVPVISRYDLRFCDRKTVLAPATRATTRCSRFTTFYNVHSATALNPGYCPSFAPFISQPQKRIPLACARIPAQVPR